MYDPITEAVDAMSLEELKANARLAIVGNAWLNLDHECIEDDHRDMADDALYSAGSAWLSKSYAEYMEAHKDDGLDEDIRDRNWHRWFLNKVPLGPDACEIEVGPEGFTYPDRKTTQEDQS